MIMSTRNFVSLGIMTGTSLDGVDLSIIKSDGCNNVIFLGGKTFSFDSYLKRSIISILGSRRRDSIIDIIERKYTDYIIKKISEFLKLRKEKIDIIGFHGQTITHNPKLKFSWQLGDAKRIYNFFKIKTIYDFRSNDIINGGCGAPLTPVFHRLLKNKYKMKNVVFVNLGGISNLTYVANNTINAFDCGPCCSVLNDLIKDKLNKSFDLNGQLALKGKTNFKIVNSLLKHAYFEIKPPKSLDRMEIEIDQLYNLDICDALATANTFIAETIFVGITKFINDFDNIILLGGGRKNKDLIKKIKSKFDKKVLIAENLGIDGDLVEANAFAYLAIRSMKKLPISFPETTGVSRPISGGKLLL